MCNVHSCLSFLPSWLMLRLVLTCDEVVVVDSVENILSRAGGRGGSVVNPTML